MIHTYGVIMGLLHLSLSLSVYHPHSSSLNHLHAQICNRLSDSNTKWNKPKTNWPKQNKIHIIDYEWYKHLSDLPNWIGRLFVFVFYDGSKWIRHQKNTKKKKISNCCDAVTFNFSAANHPYICIDEDQKRFGIIFHTLKFNGIWLCLICSEFTIQR